jgi:hypothetical protein
LAIDFRNIKCYTILFVKKDKTTFNQSLIVCVLLIEARYERDQTPRSLSASDLRAHDEQLRQHQLQSGAPEPDPAGWLLPQVENDLPLPAHPQTRCDERRTQRIHDAATRCCNRPGRTTLSGVAIQLPHQGDQALQWQQHDPLGGRLWLHLGRHLRTRPEAPDWYRVLAVRDPHSMRSDGRWQLHPRDVLLECRQNVLLSDLSRLTNKTHVPQNVGLLFVLFNLFFVSWSHQWK